MRVAAEATPNPRATPPAPSELQACDVALCAEPTKTADRRAEYRPDLRLARDALRSLTGEFAEARHVFESCDRSYENRARVPPEQLEQLFSAVAKPRTHGQLVGLHNLSDLTAGDPFQIVQREHHAILVAHSSQCAVKQVESLFGLEQLVRTPRGGIRATVDGRRIGHEALSEAPIPATMGHQHPVADSVDPGFDLAAPLEGRQTTQHLLGGELRQVIEIGCAAGQRVHSPIDELKKITLRPRAQSSLARRLPRRGKFQGWGDAGHVGPGSMSCRCDRWRAPKKFLRK